MNIYIYDTIYYLKDYGFLSFFFTIIELKSKAVVKCLSAHFHLKNNLTLNDGL